MDTAVKSPVLLFTEETPNPESLKYVTNRLLYRGVADFKDQAEAQEWSPMATALMNLPYVKAAYFSNNFVTITKEFTYDWEDIKLKVKEFVKDYLEKGGLVVKDGYTEYRDKLASDEFAANFEGEDGEVALNIKNIIDTYVKPGVEMDGGNIEFKSFKDGVVCVVMQGSCSGCPSSTVTLKSGIEGILKRMVPQVKEVVQEMG